MAAIERPDAESQAAGARQLLARRLHGVLSTLDAGRPDQPFGSVVPYCLGFDGAPLLLLSHLAQHTKNLLAHPGAALTVLDAFRGDVQQSARLTGEGAVVAAEDDRDGAERYFRYFPQSRPYHAELGFRFFRFVPERWHFNSGFATARWFGNDRLLRANPFAGGQEGEILDHMNTHHRDALPRYLASAGKAFPSSDELRLCGVDGEGMDIAWGDTVERVAFAQGVDTPEALRALLVAMARA